VKIEYKTILLDNVPFCVLLCFMCISDIQENYVQHFGSLGMTFFYQYWRLYILVLQHNWNQK